MKKLILLSLSFVAFSSYAQKVNLALNLKKDSTYNLTVDAKVTTRQVIQGKEMVAHISISGTTAHKVVALTDTAYDLETSYKSLSMGMELSGQNVNMSTADTSTLMGKMMHLIVDKPFHMWMSKTGLIISIKGFDDLFMGIAKGFPQLTEQQLNQIMTQLKQSFGEASLKSNLQQSFIIYPKQALTLKGIWKNTINREESGLSARYNTTYTLTGINDDSYEIEGKTVVVAQLASGFRSAGGFFMHMSNIKGAGTSKLRVDKNTGWVMASIIEQNLSSDVRVKQTTTGPIVASFPMTVAVSYTSTDKVIK